MRGFSHDPSGMALSHGGLGPVSRISVEDGGAPIRRQTGPDPGATQCHPHIRHPGLPKQTLLDEEEGMTETIRSGSQLQTQRDTCVVMHQTHIFIQLGSQ